MSVAEVLEGGQGIKGRRKFGMKTLIIYRLLDLHIQ